MGYRKRVRPKRDPETGVTYIRQIREVPDEYLRLLGDGVPRGTFDLEFWADENDPTCNPSSGGFSNPTSMAALGGLSERTLVNSVFPLIAHCLHREGPVVISTTNTIAAACEVYRAEQKTKQAAAGRRNAWNLIRWDKPTDPSSGQMFE